MINGVKCFVRYELDRAREQCNVQVYSKIWSKPLHFTFEDIDVPSFNPKAAVNKLYIDFNKKNEPVIEMHESIEDSYVETFSDTLYFLLPSRILSYVYGCRDQRGARLVIYNIKGSGSQNKLDVSIIYPPSLLSVNEKQPPAVQKQQFTRVIDPNLLFKYLKQLERDNAAGYEVTLNPFRYRHLVITIILKQYLRENMFLGELEMEMQNEKKKPAYQRKSTNQMQSDSNLNSKGSLGSGYNNMVLALQDNLLKNMKRKSVQITNFYKTMKDYQSTDALQQPGSARKLNKENFIVNLYQIMRRKAQDHLTSKRSMQDHVPENEVRTSDQSPASAGRDDLVTGPANNSANVRPGSPDQAEPKV